jgi:predicted dinucleotide-binding enzyme
MNIGIIGSGHVGGTLGTRWANAGHNVTFGTRKPESNEMQALAAKAGPTARAASTAEAAKADVLLLATPWEATQQVIAAAGDLSGKVLIDATNPLNDIDTLVLGTTTSAGEQVAKWARGAKVVKAFNAIGNTIMANTVFPGGKPALLYCGDDLQAKQTVHTLAGELGFEPVDAGALTMARTLEPAALLWVSLAFKQGFGREFAFQLLRR